MGDYSKEALKSDLNFPKWTGDVSVDSLRRKLTDAEIREKKSKSPKKLRQ